MRRLFVIGFIALGFYAGSQESFAGYNYYEIRDDLITQGWEFEQSSDAMVVEVLSKDNTLQTWIVDGDGIIRVDRQIFQIIAGSTFNTSKAGKILESIDRASGHRVHDVDDLNIGTGPGAYGFTEYDVGALAVAPRATMVSIYRVGFDIIVLTFFANHLEMPLLWWCYGSN
jgi:hypothetical protein